MDFRPSKFEWRGDKLMYFSKNTGAKIIPDSKWPNMYRVEYPQGTISDMTNLSRARDAAIHIVTNHLNRTVPFDRGSGAGRD